MTTLRTVTSTITAVLRAALVLSLLSWPSFAASEESAGGAPTIQILGQGSATIATSAADYSWVDPSDRTVAAAATALPSTQCPRRTTFRVLATAEGCIGQRMASGKRIRARTEGAALPSREALGKKIQIVYLANNRETAVKVLDVGPWNTDDPYWNTPGGRPQAESGRARSGRRTNGAGIDILNGSWYKLLRLRSYDRSLIENTSGMVEWNFAE